MSLLINEDFRSRSRHAKKITTDICLISESRRLAYLRGLFFEHNADIGLFTKLLSLSHTTWDCKYHLVWVPKYRKKAIFGGASGTLKPVAKSPLIPYPRELIQKTRRRFDFPCPPPMLGEFILMSLRRIREAGRRENYKQEPLISIAVWGIRQDLPEEDAG